LEGDRVPPVEGPLTGAGTLLLLLLLLLLVISEHNTLIALAVDSYTFNDLQ